MPLVGMCGCIYVCGIVLACLSTVVCEVEPSPICGEVDVCVWYSSCVYATVVL